MKSLSGALPADLPASVFILLYTAGSGGPDVAALLGPHSALPVRLAEEGQPFEDGTVTIGPHDSHLRLGIDHVHLRRGPRENNFRPSLDPTLRSIAVHHGSSGVAVVLSGLLDDGASGARAVADSGGRILVQDPLEALHPSMPEAARQAVPDAIPLTLKDLAAALAELAGETVEPGPPAPRQVRIELAIAGLEDNTINTTEKMGELSPYNCPDCNGVLWEGEDSAVPRYRCHTGHAYTEQSLSQAQEESLERSLYDALRAQRGRASLLRKTADRSAPGAHRRRLRDRAATCEEDSRLIENVLARRA